MGSSHPDHFLFFPELHIRFMNGLGMPDILKLLRRLGFDASADFPRPLGGGLSHQTWAAAAAEGTFVVKRLNPIVMKRPAAPGNFRRSELLARTLADEIPAITALRFHNDVLIPFEGGIYMVFPFQPGRILNRDEITAGHCAKIGAVLGKIHRRNIRPDAESAGIECPLHSWPLPAGQERTAVRLKQVNLLARQALEKLKRNAVMSHRDLDSKNVLWNRGEPFIIDWEAAGPVPPALELWEALLNWGRDGGGKLRPDRIAALLDAYRQWNCLPPPDWESVGHAGYAGMLGWLNYNIARSSNPALSPEERQLGAEQTAITLKEIIEYEEQAPQLRRLIDG